ICCASCGKGRIARLIAYIQECLGHVAVLVDHINQMVELIPKFEVVGPSPATLEERKILVELIMLVGIEWSKCAGVRRRGRATLLRQIIGKRISCVIDCAYAGGAPNKIGS